MQDATSALRDSGTGIYPERANGSKNGLHDEAALIYLHIPKCGGSTLSSILKKNFPGGRQYGVLTDIAASRARLAALPEKERRQIDLLYGHVSFGWHTHLPRPAIYLTIVRDPVARVVSHYNYVRFRTDHNHYLRETVEREQMSIADYVRSGVCDEVNNGQVRLLSGIEDIVQAPYGASRIPYGTNDLALLEIALRNVEEHFAVVGLQERFDESLLLIKARLDLQNITYRSTNVGRAHYSKVLPSPEELDIIRAYNKLDLMLYEAMKMRFVRDLKAMAISPLQLRGFQLRNWSRARLKSLRSAFRLGFVF